MESVDWLPDSGVTMQGPPEIFFFVLVVTVKDDFFLLLTVWKHTFPLMKSDIFLLKDSDDLVHFVPIFEVKEEASFGVNEISCVLLRNKS